MSRIQESSISIGSTSTPRPQASDASATSDGLATMVTGSNPEIARATSA